MVVGRGFYASRSGAVRMDVAGLFLSITKERLETVARASAATIKNNASNDVTDIIPFGPVARGDVVEDSNIDLSVLVGRSPVVVLVRLPQV